MVLCYGSPEIWYKYLLSKIKLSISKNKIIQIWETYNSSYTDSCMQQDSWESEKLSHLYFGEQDSWLTSLKTSGFFFSVCKRSLRMKTRLYHAHIKIHTKWVCFSYSHFMWLQKDLLNLDRDLCFKIHISYYGPEDLTKIPHSSVTLGINYILSFSQTASAKVHINLFF